MSVSLKCAVLLLMSFTLDSLKASDLDDVISELYEQYKEAVADENYTSSRRVFKRNKQYELHVQKLKEVNGLKYHNLVLREKLRNDPNEYIYISNPLESKMPKAFLTIEEFKQQLTNRIVRQRLTKTLKTTLSTKPKVKVNRKKRTQLPRYTNSGTSSQIKSKSTVSATPVKGNKYDNKKIKKNNELYPTHDPNKRNKIKSRVNTSTTYFNKHVDTNTSSKPPNSAMKLVTSKSELSNLKRSKFKNPLKALTKTTVFSNTLLNVSRKTKDALRRKTTIQSMTSKNIMIKRQTPTTELRYFKNAIMRKLTTSTRTPILKSTYTNKTTVKLITINLTKDKSTFQESVKTTSVTPNNNDSNKEESLKKTSVDTTTEDASTVVHLTSEKDLTTETISTSKEISRKDLILKNTTTEEMNTLQLTPNREVSTTERLTTATYISLKDPISEDTNTRSELMLLPTEDLKSASLSHINEIFKRETFEDTTTEKVTTTHNITTTHEFNDNLNNKLFTTPRQIYRNDSTLDNIFEILSVPKEMFGKESTFEDTTINMWTTTESSTKNLKSLLRLAHTMMKSCKPAKRTPRRKKKVRLIETTINTTKYKRLERPLVFMGGYGQPMNKLYAKNVNGINFK